LTITPAPLTIQANDVSKVYGAAVPGLTASYIGFVNGDGPSSLAAPALLATTATAASLAGTYPITVGHAASPDYAITFRAGTLTVTPTTPSPTPTSTPPLVTIMQVQAVTKKHRVLQIVLTFSGALNVAEAQAPATYRLAIAGKRGSFTARNAKVIKLKLAAYNAANDTVTLTPRKPFAISKPVQLQVDGLPPSGLEDSLGRLIDGNRDGQPGGNAIAILGRRGVTISAVVSSSGTASIFESAVVDVLLELKEMRLGKTFARALRSKP
jgi:hypothetical protein